jgi:nucleotide-binding universal stress UspA family protein
MMLKTVLVPLDGSTLAEQFLAAAASLAHDTGASLVLVRAHVPDKEREDAQLYLQSVQQRLVGEGLSVRTETLPSHAATAILTAAQEQQADLICMTSHGMTGLRHALLGSVTETVVRYTFTPVLVVHALHQPAPPPMPLRKILVLLDGSPPAETTLSFLAQEPFGPSVEILLLRVVAEKLVAMPAMLSNERIAQIAAEEDQATEPERTEAAAYLDRLGQQYLAKYVWHAQVAHGLPEDEILSIARTEQAGAILMATHARHGFDLFFHGSMAHRLLDQTEVPLILVPAQLSKEHAN